MRTTLRQIARPLMALAAIAAALSAGEASASCAMTPGDPACVTGSGCCTRRASDSDAKAPASASVAVAPPLRAQTSCQASPDEGCSCRAQAPASPASRPSRSADERQPEPSPNAALADFGQAVPSHGLRSPQVPATQSPPERPLYLRDVRLLI